jgi:hypothetical protein
MTSDATEFPPPVSAPRAVPEPMPFKRAPMTLQSFIANLVVAVFLIAIAGALAAYVLAGTP